MTGKNSIHVQYRFFKDIFDLGLVDLQVDYRGPPGLFLEISVPSYIMEMPAVCGRDHYCPRFACRH
jgi:hypothetical protein